MSARYAALYRDRHGDVVTTIHNDGKTLSMIARGVEFRGTDFDAFEPIEGTDPTRLTSFTLQHGCLCSCSIEAEMPPPLVLNGETLHGLLTMHLELGEPMPNGSLDREVLRLTLTLGESVYRSAGTSGWFEDELLDIQKQLPDGVYLKACINCAFSDYSPVGHGLFGGLACFRDNKAGYLAVKGKDDLFRIWSTATEYVQETYLCPEFRRRVPGTGYRG
jgi:hypothetical protein